MVLTSYTKDFRDLHSTRHKAMPPYVQASNSDNSWICKTDEMPNEKVKEIDSEKVPERTVKCVLLGDGAVGKTSLVVSYTTNGYPTEYVPTAFDNYSVVLKVDSQPVKFQLCDTAGQDDFDTLRPLCYPETDVFLLCFSVVSPTSYINVLEKWFPEVHRHCPKTPIILVGTQCDLRTDVNVLIDLAKNNERPVTEAEATQRAKIMNAVAYLECSALTQHNMKEVFDAAMLSALKITQPPRRKSKLGKKYLKSPQKQKPSTWKKLCCIV
ncbi:cell division control protein 42 homolog [Anneissia japonica]|uniref:cell division control protein 42 homolog n=1 Tax=Anneissia japonica TaxID=1529436 RepID=UPI0014258391|nr:cell division control protein 42 homolog [Anneissia japonica]